MLLQVCWMVSFYLLYFTLCFSCISLQSLVRGSLRFIYLFIFIFCTDHAQLTNFYSFVRVITFFLVYVPNNRLPHQKHCMQLSSMNISAMTLSKMILVFNPPVFCAREFHPLTIRCVKKLLNILLDKFIQCSFLYCETLNKYSLPLSLIH